MYRMRNSPNLSLTCINQQIFLYILLLASPASHEWKQPKMLLLQYRTVTIKLNILWCVKKAKHRETNIYDYDVNDVVLEIVIKSIGNVTIKHLFLSCFYSRFEKPVFHFLPFSEFKMFFKKKEKKRKEKKSIAF